MTDVTKKLLFALIFSAFLFGYLDLFFEKSFERLHIFLFNLCTGCFVILKMTETKIKSNRSYIFLLLSLIYALFAFLELYILAIVISLVLAIIVESIRIQTFSFFPFDFFKKDIDVSTKFNHASMLCISMALVISAIVILNNEFFKWVEYEKLKLNVFFLGFSFPVSLITMSVIFSYIKKGTTKIELIFENFCFWSVNLGVILFFIFIIFELFIPMIAVTSLLFFTVILIFLYFIKKAVPVQEKLFLLSGVFFLLSTAITGIIYILLKPFPAIYEGYGKLVLKIHSFLSLYGWNLSGLFIIIRWDDFPLKLNTLKIILFHWAAIAVIAPLGRFNKFFAGLSALMFFSILYIFFSEDRK
jgi:hypothetical protein